jgi:hypothetical protein
MSRIRMVAQTLYTWAELDGGARDNARAKRSADLWESGYMTDVFTSIFAEKMLSMGWDDGELRTFNLYQQGGFPSFRCIIPEFTVDGVTYSGRVTTRASGGGSEYMVATLVDAGLDGSQAMTRLAEQHLKVLLHDVSMELFYQFRDADDEAVNDEAMAEWANDMGIEFFGDGERA